MARRPQCVKLPANPCRCQSSFYLFANGGLFAMLVKCEQRSALGAALQKLHRLIDCVSKRQDYFDPAKWEMRLTIHIQIYGRAEIRYVKK